MQNTADIQKPDLVSPISKALHILDIVGDADQSMRFQDLSELLPFPRATTHRLLKLLVSERMLAFDDNRRTYRLGHRLFQQAHRSWARNSMTEIAGPYLTELCRQTGLTVHLATLEGGNVLYLDKRLPHRPVTMFSNPGRIASAYCTGLGKALLASLDQSAMEEAIALQSYKAYTAKTLTSQEMLKAALIKIQQKGLAYDDEEHEVGILCLAMALPDLEKSTLPHAISITSTVLQGSLVELEQRCAETLKTITIQISEKARAGLMPGQGQD